MSGQLLEFLISQLTNTPSRRDVLRALAGAGTGLSTARQGVGAETKRKRKRRRKRNRQVEVGEPNAFGCLSEGQHCRNGVQCCSGVCKGKERQRTCRAHDAGTCDREEPGVCTGVVTGCNDGVNCTCMRTTAESQFCGNFSTNAILEVDCSTDADCEALGLPPGSACVPVSEGFCAELFEAATICIAPCGLTIPPS